MVIEEFGGNNRDEGVRAFAAWPVHACSVKTPSAPCNSYPGATYNTKQVVFVYV